MTRPMPAAAALAHAYRHWLNNDNGHTRIDPLENLDAHWECRHGHLPHDPHKDPACTCWPATPTEEAA